jgi:hypothetical protein
MAREARDNWSETSCLQAIFTHFLPPPPNGLRYLRVGGRGFCLGAGKTRSEKNA